MVFYIHPDFSVSGHSIAYQNRRGRIADSLIGEFYNECLRESLRYEISVETKNLRELIVGRALYTTCIELDENEDNQEQSDGPIYEDDNTEYSLEDIAVNWFEKYEDSEEKKC